MKRKFLFALVGLLATTLASCETPSTSASISSPSEVSSLTSSSVEVPSSPESSNLEVPSSSEASSFEELSTVEVNKNGSCGGRLIDINVNTFLCNDTDYECTFASSKTDKTIRVTSSHENVLTVTQDTVNPSKFIINSHEVGDSILCIYDYQGVLCYRKVIRVRPKIAVEDVPSYLFNIDYFVNLGIFGGTYRMTFTSDDPLSGTYTGRDDYESNQYLEFNCKFEEYQTDIDFYRYSIEITARATSSSNPQTETTISSFLLSPAGDCLMLYYTTGGEEHILDELCPNTLIDLRKNA